MLILVGNDISYYWVKYDIKNHLFLECAYQKIFNGQRSSHYISIMYTAWPATNIDNPFLFFFFPSYNYSLRIFLQGWELKASCKQSNGPVMKLTSRPAHSIWDPVTLKLAYIKVDDPRFIKEKKICLAGRT